MPKYMSAPEWARDPEVYSTLHYCMSQDIPRQKMCSLMNQKFPQYSCSIRSMQRRLNYFGIFSPNSQANRRRKQFQQQTINSSSVPCIEEQRTESDGLRQNVFQRISNLQTEVSSDENNSLLDSPVNDRNIPAAGNGYFLHDIAPQANSQLLSHSKEVSRETFPNEIIEVPLKSNLYNGVDQNAIFNSANSNVTAFNPSNNPCTQTTTSNKINNNSNVSIYENCDQPSNSTANNFRSPNILNSRTNQSVFTNIPNDNDSPITNTSDKMDGKNSNPKNIVTKRVFQEMNVGDDFDENDLSDSPGSDKNGMKTSKFFIHNVEPTRNSQVTISKNGVCIDNFSNEIIEVPLKSEPCDSVSPNNSMQSDYAIYNDNVFRAKETTRQKRKRSDHTDNRPNMHNKNEKYGTIYPSCDKLKYLVKFHRDTDTTPTSEYFSSAPGDSDANSISSATDLMPVTNSQAFLKWDTNDVCEWLNTHGLSMHEKSFKENEIKGDHLQELSREDLRDLGIVKIGHRLTFEREAKKLLLPIYGSHNHKTIAITNDP